MKTQYISGSFFAFLLFVLSPLTTHAYFTTAQHAVALNAQTALFTIEYAFGLEDHDIYMPVLAVRNLSVENDAKNVGYTIREDEITVTTAGTATGIVLSKAPIVDGMYKLAKGAAHKMTLLVLYSTKVDAFEEDYALQVDSLPYTVDRETVMQKLQLNPSELTYYITPEAELNTGNYEN